MYFKNLCRNNLFTKSEKKKLAITYKINEPIDIEDIVINVPIHFPNKIPDIISNGDANPNKTIQIIENIRK